MENFNIMQFETVGQYDIPILRPYTKHLAEDVTFIGFNYAKKATYKENKGLHFFLDDYQFERLWREPTKYTKNILGFNCVFTPDFSLYTDYPKAMQIYNHYRKHWLGAYWQSWGLNVIPTIGWSDKDSFAWCFDGEPKHATVAVSSVGTQKSKECKKLFLQGYEKMMEVLEPETIIFYGNVPEECRGDIVRIKAFQDKFTEVLTDGR